MSRGQINTQVLVYILALIITSIILVYGYGTIKDIMARGQVAELIRMKTDLKGYVKSIANDYGSIEIKTLSVPGDYREICFVSSDLSNADIDAKISGKEYPIIRDSMIDSLNLGGEKRNMFLCPKCVEQDYVGDLVVENGFKCLPVKQGTVKIRLEGLGDKTALS
jgi:hypothetical protein